MAEFLNKLCIFESYNFYLAFADRLIKTKKLSLFYLFLHFVAKDVFATLIKPSIVKKIKSFAKSN